MSLSVWELHDLVLDRRTIPWATRGDRSAVHRRLRDVVLDDLLPFSFEVGNPARLLRGMPGGGPLSALLRPEMRPGIIELFDLTLLDFQSGIVDGSAIDTRRCSGLEARDGKP